MKLYVVSLGKIILKAFASQEEAIEYIALQNLALGGVDHDYVPGAFGGVVEHRYRSPRTNRWSGTGYTITEIEGP